MKLGDKVNFNFEKGKKFEVKEIVKDTNLPLTWEWSKKTCPHCSNSITGDNYGKELWRCNSNLWRF